MAQRSHQGPRLLDQMRDALRVRHYSPRTEEAYTAWVRRFVRFCGLRHPAELGPEAVSKFLTYLATARGVFASTQNQALAALLFLYGKVLGQPLENAISLVRAKSSRHLPVALSPADIDRVFAQLDGDKRLMAELLYGSGLRVLECVSLRVKDLEFDRGEIVVRDAKGRKDRVTMLPRTVESRLREHLGSVRLLHQRDRARGAGWVQLPMALGRKYPNAGQQWPW